MKMGTTIEALEPRKLLSAGVIDLHYGADGRAALPFTSGRIVGTQPGGRTIVEQFTYGSASSKLWRINVDGTVDNTFSVTLSDFPVPNDPNSGSPLNRDGDIEVNPNDGRIAYIRQGTGGHEVAVLTADGAVDPEFDGDGIRDLTAGLQAWDLRPIRDLVWQGENLIVASEKFVSQNNSTKLVTLSRLLRSGETDFGFGVSGERTQAEPASATTVRADVAAVDNRVMILTKGSADNFLTISRYTPNGTLVTAYGSNGAKTVSLPTSSDGALGFDLATDGSVDLILSSDGLASPTGIKIVEVKPDSSDGISKTFSLNSGDGSYLGDYTPTQSARTLDGHWLLAGASKNAGGGWGVGRLTSAGALDTTFGTNGSTVVDVSYAAGSRAYLPADGRVVVGGKKYTKTGTFQTVRLNSELPQVSLNRKGTMIIYTSDNAETISFAVRSKDGRWVLRVGDYAQSLAPSRVKRIAMFTYGGNDTVTINLGVKGAYVEGGEGNDTLNGGGGGDVLVGSAGNDQLFGNDGNDTLVGSEGDDYCLGGTGKDDLFGFEGKDTLSAGGGNDRLFGGAEADQLTGGPGSDSADNDPLDNRASDIETLLA